MGYPRLCDVARNSFFNFISSESYYICDTRTDFKSSKNVGTVVITDIIYETKYMYNNLYLKFIFDEIMKK